MLKNGVLLINVGTPEAPNAAAVRTYLKQFLSDKRMLDIPMIGRWLLLNCIILPFRPRRSAEAYSKIWTEKGSPLLSHGQDLTQAVQKELQNAEIPVVLGMRYGQPSIPSALQKLRKANCDRIIVLPLFPQYASSSTGSALELVYQETSRLWNTPFLQVLPPFLRRSSFY